MWVDLHCYPAISPFRVFKVFRAFKDFKDSKVGVTKWAQLGCCMRKMRTYELRLNFLYIFLAAGGGRWG